MMFENDLLFYIKRIETLAYDLKALSLKKADIYRDGDNTLLSELDAKIKEIEDEKEPIRREYHELLIRLVEIAQRGIESRVENFC